VSFATFLELRTRIGAHIDDVAEEAVRLVERVGCDVQFEFSGIRIMVSDDDTALMVADRYRRRARAEGEGTVSA
jgi:hypothetical protein